MVNAAEVCAANPCHDVMRAIFMPTVAMMRHPPKLVPMPIVRAHTTMTQKGISNTWVAPPASMVSANTPMNFCPSLRP